MQQEQKKSSKLSKWAKRIAWLFLFFVGAWLLGDLGYSWFVKSKQVAWEESVTRNADGILEGCEAYSVGPKSELALLMVHGINDSPHVFRKPAEFLADRGVFCRCMRLTGFGESVEHYDRASINDWILDVDREVMALRKNHRRVILVAHSLGGAIAINYVAQNPDGVDGLILVAPAIQVSSQRSPILPVQYWHSLLSNTLLFTDTTYSPFGVDALDPQQKNNPFRTPFTPLKIINQVFELVDRNQDAATKMTLPLLLIVAEKDHVVDNLAARTFFDRSPSETKAFVSLKNSAHAIMVDYQWPDFANSVFNFVETFD